MPQPHTNKGTVKVNIDEMELLVQHLGKFKHTLDEHKSRINSLDHELAYSISGTAPDIATFEQRFDHWVHLLDTVIGEMDVAYHTLHFALAEARENDIGGLLQALREGSKKLNS